MCLKSGLTLYWTDDYAHFFDTVLPFEAFATFDLLLAVVEVLRQ